MCTKSNNCFYNANSYKDQGNDADNYYSSYICKFSNTGQRIWSTYYGTSTTYAYCKLNSLTVDGNFLYITGNTVLSNNIATTGVFQYTKSGPIYHAYYVDPITHKSTPIISKNNNATNLISDKNNSPRIDKGANSDVVELNSGKKWGWNKELNKPKPNMIYRVDNRYD